MNKDDHERELTPEEQEMWDRVALTPLQRLCNALVELGNHEEKGKYIKVLNPELVKLIKEHEDENSKNK